MFKFLKEKISSIFKSEEKPKKTSKKKSKKENTKKKASIQKQKKENVKNKKEKTPQINQQTTSSLKKEKSQEVKETFIEEEKESKPSFFSKLAQKLTTSTLTKEDFDSFFDEFEMSLLENNVALKVVDKIKETLSQELIGKNFKKSEVAEKILEALKKSINTLLIEPPDLIEQIKTSKKPFVIIFFGINGSGKTTTIAKFANKLKKEGFSLVLGAADTFRAASIEQLEEHAKRLNIPIVKKEYNSDPASVAFETIQYAKKEKKDVVLIDTAGRMYTQSNLMREMEKIIKVSQPNLKIFVGESITGNDATEQASAFNNSVGIDGIILSKADIDEKAGTILSVSYITNKPIYFLGIGQGYDDLEKFSKKKILKNLGLE